MPGILSHLTPACKVLGMTSSMIGVIVKAGLWTLDTGMEYGMEYGLDCLKLILILLGCQKRKQYADTGYTIIKKIIQVLYW